ncbi:putative RNA-binding protein 19 [Phytophthora pseudosyringae]|uniref:Putative RNA-binding protein 19 n=1 Tax=Phytophthora pseudosyringae TaxID=221518 RepID=A0A8T1V9K7_9STRA|nr:putative RNA-binding protein 19 [Phytophthora pseudosyringae]
MLRLDESLVTSDQNKDILVKLEEAGIDLHIAAIAPNLGVATVKALPTDSRCWPHQPSQPVHLNRFVRDKENGAVAHVTVLPAGISALDNKMAEAQEEAALEPSCTHSWLVAAGSISYVFKHPYGLTNDIMFTFDVELPTNIVPANQDGEVESCDLISVQDALSRRSESECILLLDFFVRHGALPADNFVDYEKLQRASRSTENL